MATDKTHREMERLLDQMQQQAYQRGWHDAVASIVSSAQSLSGTAVPVLAKEPTTTRRAGKRVRRGSVPKAILKVLRQRDRLTYAEIETEAKVEGRAIPAGSIRSAMRRLQQNGEVRRENNQWFLAQGSMPEIVGQEGVDADPSTLPDTTKKGEAHVPA